MALHPEIYLAALARRPRAAARTAERSGLHELLARAGHPERRLRTVHIAGSKGKGTTALMLDAMLRAGGRRTGVFTSPHLERWTERIRIDGQEVDAAVLADVLAELHPHVTELHARPGLNGPDFFELLLVAALLLFEKAGVDEAVIEAGIGARFDATMVVQPAVTALTSVELEHTPLLGRTLRAVAQDKGHIARAGVPLVLGRLREPARREVLALAAQAGAPAVRSHGCLLADECGAVVAGRSARVRLPLPAPSRALADCAGVAFACAEQLGVLADPASAARAGLAALTLPGRQEVLAREPLVVADGAHTEASFGALLDMLAVLMPSASPLHLVVSTSGQRDLAAMAAPLLRRAHAVFVTRADPARSAEPGAVAAELRAYCPTLIVETVESPAAALTAALADLPRAGTLCATGSMYMAGWARRHFRPLAEEVRRGQATTRVLPRPR